MGVMGTFDHDAREQRAGSCFRSGTAISVVWVRYPDGRGILRQALQAATARGFAVDELSVSALPG